MNITTKEVIKALGISKSTYYRWKRQGIVEQKIKEKAKLLELLEKGKQLQKAGKRVALVSSPDKYKGGGRYAK
jgi:predicted site-specific integrase-resolvase